MIPDPLFDPGLSFPVFAPDMVNNITFTELLELRRAAVFMAFKFGYVMFAIGLLLGAVIGIGLYRAFISPGYLIPELERLAGNKDSSYTTLADRMGEDEGKG